jgi:hypothetical protein
VSDRPFPFGHAPEAPASRRRAAGILPASRAGAPDLLPATGPLPFRAPPPPMAITQPLPIERVTDPLVGFVPPPLPVVPPPPPARPAPQGSRGLLVILALVLLALDAAGFWLVSAHGGW